MSASRVTLSGMHEFHLVLDFALNPFNQASSLVALTVKNLPVLASPPCPLLPSVPCSCLQGGQQVGLGTSHVSATLDLTAQGKKKKKEKKKKKNMPANAGDPGLDPPGRDSPLEEGMETHCSTLAWRFPQTEEPDGLLSMGSQRAGQD